MKSRLIGYVGKQGGVLGVLEGVGGHDVWVKKGVY